MDIDPEDLPRIDWRAHLPGRWEVLTILLASLLVGALAVWVLSS